jgi:hypothetical protein
MAVPELACIAGFCIMLYWCSVGRSAVSGGLFPVIGGYLLVVAWHIRLSGSALLVLLCLVR